MTIIYDKRLAPREASDDPRKPCRSAVKAILETSIGMYVTMRGAEETIRFLEEKIAEIRGSE
jgi:hypothetical protein